jgi:hypothetical protein
MLQLHRKIREFKNDLEPLRRRQRAIQLQFVVFQFRAAQRARAENLRAQRSLTLGCRRTRLHFPIVSCPPMYGRSTRGISIVPSAR